jgi:hypothetical protein
VLAAFLSVLADLEWPAVVGVTGLAWAIAAMVEWLAWQPGMVWPGQRRYKPIRPAPPATESPVQPSASPEPPPVVYAEPPAEEQTPEPLYEPEPSPPVEEPVAEEPAPTAEQELVGAGLVPPAEPEPTGDREPRERRSWLTPMRRRPSGTDSEPPREEREPETVEERRHPRPRAVEIPPPAPEPTASPPPAPEETSVVRMSSRRAPEPQQWNLWDLESIARQEARSHPARRDEWSYLFVHLRQFADAEGTLPSEFDALVRESFGEMLEARNLV